LPTLVATPVEPYINLLSVIQAAQALDSLDTHMKCRIVGTATVGDSDLSKTHEPGGPADGNEDLDTQWKVISGDLTYEPRIYVPADALLCNKVISLFLDNPESGYFGGLRTAELLSRDFYCPTLDTIIRKFFAGCEICPRLYAPCHARHGVNMPLLPSSEPWPASTMDFATDCPESTAWGYTGIAVIDDRLTKMAIFLPCGKDVD
jgi:hypothetical protein